MSLYKKNTNVKKVTGKIIPIIIFIVLIGVLFVITNNQNSTTINSENDLKTDGNNVDFFHVQIIISEDFGDSTLFSRAVEIAYGDSAIDVLDKVSNVTYNYGGGFVESIDGIRSTYSNGAGGKDWFYYINGMLSSVGASQYTLQPDDVERWDYHSWNSDRIATAIIGDYPEPFTHGFQGHIRNTTVVYSKAFQNDAYGLQQSLKQYSISVSVRSFKNLSDDEKIDDNLILIDTYNNSLINELNTNARNLGLFIEFRGDKLVTFDKAGKEDHIFDQGGVILATKNPWGPKGNWNSENVVWVISGVTKENVIEAAGIITGNSQDIENYPSLVVSNGQIYKVP